MNSVLNFKLLTKKELWARNLSVGCCPPLLFVPIMPFHEKRCMILHNSFPIERATSADDSSLNPIREHTSEESNFP